MVKVTIADFIVGMAESIPEDIGEHALLADKFQLDHTHWDAYYVQVQRGRDWPFLCVAQRYSPGYWAGSYPGILFVPESHILFVGAGERLLAYELNGPTRLWEDQADAGFQCWQRHGDVVIMSAEMDLAAWDIQGNKLWTTFAEPPWEYQVDQDTVRLDVMGTISTFPLATGPSSQHTPHVG